MPKNKLADTMALFIALSHVFSLVSSTSSPEDMPAGSALQLTFGEQVKSYDEDVPDSFTSAYINITRQDQFGLKWEKSETGRYGGGFIAPISGGVVHISSEDNLDDHTGCHLPFTSSNRFDRSLPDLGEPWIALIRRGRCTFETKVENAFRSNAIGVLVYNDRDSSNLDKMKLSSDIARNITAVFTYKWKGEEIARLLENDSKILVQITVAGRTTSRSATINRTSVLFVSVTFIVLMIISLAWLVFYYVQRFRYIHAKDRLSRRLCNAAKKALSKIPTKSIKSDDREVEDGECCAICIEPYKTSDVLRMLPCQHEFHKSCIDPWLLEHRTCPMCKMDILRHYGFMQFSGSQESILHMDTEDVALGVGSNDSQDSGSPRRGGVSPLPQIRTVALSERRRSYGSSIDLDHSSRSSTPDETTPSLSSTRRQQPVHPDLCINCIAAAATKINLSLDDSHQKSFDLPVSSRSVQHVLSQDDMLLHSAQVQNSNDHKDNDSKIVC